MDSGHDDTQGSPPEQTQQRCSLSTGRMLDYKLLPSGRCCLGSTSTLRPCRPHSHVSQGDHCRGAAQGGGWGHLSICLFLHKKISSIRGAPGTLETQNTYLLGTSRQYLQLESSDNFIVRKKTSKAYWAHREAGKWTLGMTALVPQGRFTDAILFPKAECTN